MEAIICCLFGIFIGYATCALFAIDEINKKDRKITNQNAMIKNRDLVIDKQSFKLERIKAILSSNEIFTEKFNKIKELFPETNQDK